MIQAGHYLLSDPQLDIILGALLMGLGFLVEIFMFPSDGMLIGKKEVSSFLRKKETYDSLHFLGVL